MCCRNPIVPAGAQTSTLAMRVTLSPQAEYFVNYNHINFLAYIRFI